MILRLLLAVAIAGGFCSCASDELRTESGKKLELQTVRRPNRPPVYMYRAVNE